MVLTTIFPFGRWSCESCGFHVLRISAKIDPYVETFPKLHTHILSFCVTSSNPFSKIPELHFTYFNNGLNIHSGERGHLISFCSVINYEWSSYNSGVFFGY